MMQILDRGTQCLANEIVVIDGFSSSGKSLFGPFLGYLKRCEQWQIDGYYENIAVMNYLGVLDAGAVPSLLKTYADKHIYNLAIGRNVNFRRSDCSSPYFDGLQDKYLARLTAPEGDVVADKMKMSKPILPINIHNVFGFSDILIRGFDERLKLYILTLRDPIYLIEAWHVRNWNNRICKVDREFTLCCLHEGISIPWFVVEYADQYLAASDLRKSILVLYNYYSGIFRMFNNLDSEVREKLFIVPFEDFACNSIEYIEVLCGRLGTEKNEQFDSFVASHQVESEVLPWSDSSEQFIERYASQLKADDISTVRKLGSMYQRFIERNSLFLG